MKLIQQLLQGLPLSMQALTDENFCHKKRLIFGAPGAEVVELCYSKAHPGDHLCSSWPSSVARGLLGTMTYRPCPLDHGKVAWSGCPSLGPSDPGGWKKPKVGGPDRQKLCKVSATNGLTESICLDWHELVFGKGPQYCGSQRFGCSPVELG